MKRVSAWLGRVVIWFYGILMALILILCVMGSNMMYYTKKSLPYHNLLYLAAGCLLIVLLRFIAVWCAKSNLYQKYGRRIMLALNILLGMGLIVMAYHYYFRTGWDAGVVITEAGKIAHSDYDNLWNWYFSRCSNNIFITVIFSWVIRVGSLLGFGNDYFYLVAFQCIGWAYVGYMVWLIAGKLCSTKAGALLAWMLYVILVGLSPWVVVPYTDTVGMFVFTTVIYLFLNKKHPLLLGVLLASGYFVKPLILIVGIAAVILYGLDFLGDLKKNTKVSVRNIMWTMAGILLGLLIVNVGRETSHIQVDNQRTLGVPHYLMLGLNERTNGVFSEEDLVFSESFGTQDERNAANWQMAGERLKEMGTTGLLAHLGRKLLTVYNDGSFAWGTEGGFFEELFFSGQPQLREFLRGIYIPEGKYYFVFLNVMQTVWMGILCLTVFVFASEKKEKSVTVLALAIIGFTMFELLVEPRARHTLIYISVWIPFACMGLENMSQWIEKKRKIKR